ncbi:hypothetical protein JZ751_001089 [Albula glossodonta]|uniref:Uncharacterized protein n=1 Tax=Albula glossodonta TaxID=121402 RepID=A0A8T2PSJ0_9TELE|nr:hypothetical protein JZ751_001089 [Albula glossodonta]
MKRTGGCRPEQKPEAAPVNIVAPRVFHWNACDIMRSASCALCQGAQEGCVRVLSNTRQSLWRITSCPLAIPLSRLPPH